MSPRRFCAAGRSRSPPRARRQPAACAAGTGPLRLTIAFTGDVSGYLEPCG